MLRSEYSKTTWWRPISFIEIAMKEISLKNLKEYLKQRSKEELIGEISDLFTKYEYVKDYYQVKLGQSDGQVLQKYKDIIEDEFFPTRGFGKARLSVARKAISDYQKMSPTSEGLADIMIFFVEMGVKFTNAYGDINEPFYNSMESMYKRAIKFITDHGIQDMFKTRCIKIVEDTVNIGWGFHDGLSNLYYECFET